MRHKKNHVRVLSNCSLVLRCRTLWCSGTHVSVYKE